MSDDLSASLAAATLMAATSSYHQEQPELQAQSQDVVTEIVEQDSYIKTNLRKLKTANETGKNELQKLNLELKEYLDRAKFLESQNQKLMREVDEAKSKRAPKLDLNEIAAELERARIDLESESKVCVYHEVNIEKNANLKEDYSNRLKFYLKEEDQIRLRIQALTAELNDINQERDYIKKSTNQVTDDIEREKGSMFRAEDKMSDLRDKLSQLRYKNKCIEFEMQTLEDEKQFLRAINEEELNALRRFYKETPTSADFTQFYKTELQTAVKDIRADFKQLLSQQLIELKEQKEAELNNYREQEYRKAEVLKTRRAQSQEREVADIQLSQLPETMDQSRKELKALNAQNIELTQRLAALEDHFKAIKINNTVECEKRDDIINDLRLRNESFLSDLDYLDRITKTRLESEIQAYRSILNTQYRLLISNKEDVRPLSAESRPMPVASIVEEQNNTTISSLESNVSTSRPSSVTIVEDYPQVKLPPVTEPSAVIIGSSVKVVEDEDDNEDANSSGQASSLIVESSVKIVDEQETKLSYLNDTPINSSNYQVLSRLFEKYDRNRNGRINSSELSEILRDLDVKLSNDECERVLRQADADKSRDIDFNEFCALISPLLFDELYLAFKKFDRDGSGYITTQEIHELLSSMGYSFSETRISALLSTVDTNADGRLNFDEFKALVNGGKPIERETKVEQSVAEAKVVVVEQEETPTRKSLRKIFDSIDNDKSGYISSREFANIFKNMDLEVSEVEFEELLKNADTDNDRNIDFEEFCQIMEPAMRGNFKDDDLWNAFKAFDKDQSGYISTQELLQILQGMGQTFNEQDIAKLVQSVDGDNDGQLSYAEFAKLMKRSL